VRETPGFLRVIPDARGDPAAAVIEYGLASFTVVLDAAVIAEQAPRTSTVLAVDPGSDAGARLVELAPAGITVLSVGGREGDRAARAVASGTRSVRYRTDADGALVFETDGRRLDVTRWATGHIDRHCLDPDSPGC
jgi:hypothetical protein